MPIGVGIGAGDIIAVGKLAKNIIQELKEVSKSLHEGFLRGLPSLTILQDSEAASKYQNLLVELEFLSRALSRLNTLQPDHHELAHLEAIRAAAEACRRPLEDFLKKIHKYDKSLGIWGAKEKRFQNFGRRVQFNSLDEGVKELRTTLSSYMTIIHTSFLAQIM